METRTLLSAITHLLTPFPTPTGCDPRSAGGPAPEELPPNPLYFPTGQPTRHEMARQRFVAKFVGPFTVGAGRFSGEAQQVYMRGSGGSNSSSTVTRNSRSSRRRIRPSRSAVRSVRSIGTSTRTVRSDSELAANPATDLDAAGRPARMTITQVDGNLSGGGYAGAIAEGTVEIRYKPSGARIAPRIEPGDGRRHDSSPGLRPRQRSDSQEHRHRSRRTVTGG